MTTLANSLPSRQSWRSRFDARQLALILRSNPGRPKLTRCWCCKTQMRRRNRTTGQVFLACADRHAEPL